MLITLALPATPIAPKTKIFLFPFPKFLSLRRIGIALSQGKQGDKRGREKLDLSPPATVQAAVEIPEVQS
jgi:hypothetical protein